MVPERINVTLVQEQNPVGLHVTKKASSSGVISLSDRTRLPFGIILSVAPFCLPRLKTHQEQRHSSATGSVHGGDEALVRRNNVVSADQRTFSPLSTTHLK